MLLLRAVMGWMPIVYLGTIADEAAEYNPN